MVLFGMGIISGWLSLMALRVVIHRVHKHYLLKLVNEKINE